LPAPDGGLEDSPAEAAPVRVVDAAVIDTGSALAEPVTLALLLSPL